MKRNLDEIYKYYKELGVECFWTTDSLSLYEINLITDTFEELHKKYPEIIIEEIGDYYSIDKIKHDKNIDYLREKLKIKNYCTDNPELIEKIKKFDIESLEKLEKKVINVNNEKYRESEFSAEYGSKYREIRFNHLNKCNLKESVYHEFGHAIAYQYDINNNKDINEFFNSMDNYMIELFISEYATTNIKEFIAEIFAQYNLGNRNYIIDKVMGIFNKEVENGEPMGEIERFVKKSFDDIINK